MHLERGVIEIYDEKSGVKSDAQVPLPALSEAEQCTVRDALQIMRNAFDNEDTPLARLAPAPPPHIPDTLAITMRGIYANYMERQGGSFEPVCISAHCLFYFRFKSQRAPLPT